LEGWIVEGRMDGQMKLYQVKHPLPTLLPYPATHLVPAESNPGTSPLPSMKRPHTNRNQAALTLWGEQEDHSKEPVYNILIPSTFPSRIPENKNV